MEITCHSEDTMDMNGKNKALVLRIKELGNPTLKRFGKIKEGERERE